MRGEYFRGLDSVDDGQGFEESIAYGRDKDGCYKCRLCCRKCDLCWHKWSPLGTTVEKIRNKYDKVIGGYFIMFRLLVLISLAHAILFLYLLCYHMAKTTDFGILWMFYISFYNWEAMGYVITILFFLIIGILISFFALVWYDRERRMQSHYLQDGTKRFAKQVLNGLDWNTKHRSDMIDHRIQKAI
jgi:hypothetical protein